MCDASHLSIFQEATTLYNNRNFEQCLSLLSKCLQVCPTSMVLNNRGIVNYRLGNFSQARQDLENSIKLDHLNFLAYFNLFSINTLHEQEQAAFDNLSLALSSLNTTKCRQERNIIYADQALYYSSNNKEAMMIKGLIYLQQKEYHQSLEMIRQALRWEPKESHRQEMIAVMCLVAEMTHEGYTDLDIKFVGGPLFKLKSSLPQPSKDQYTLKIKSMLQEFNRLYQSVLHSAQSDIESSSIQQASHILQAHSDMFLKEDKSSNKVTANNSIMINDHDSSLSDYQRNKDISNILLPQTKESLPLVDRTTENSVILQEESAITNVKAEQVNSNESKPRRQIKFTVQFAEISKHSLSEIYAVLQYNKCQNNLFITSLASSQNQCYIWNEVSEAFYLSSNPQNLTLKLYSKDFSRFNDELIGKGTFLIGQLGTGAIPLYRGFVQTGNIVVGVAMIQ